MRYVSFFLVILTLAAAGVFSQSPRITSAQTPDRNGDIIRGRYIVVLKESAVSNTPGSRVGDIANDLEARSAFRRDVQYNTALKGFAANMTDSAAAQVRSDPRVLLVEPDRIAHIFDQAIPTGISRAEVDQNATADIDGSGPDLDIDVAIIDTGIASHSDLRIAGGWAKYCNSRCTYSFDCGVSTSSYDDGQGHGTHVAGTVGARDNTSGVVGVAPGARLWAVKVLNNSGYGCYSDIIAGIDWVRTQGSIKVANMSIGGSSYTPLCIAVSNAVNAGVTIAVAAGNSNANASNYSPANCSDAITVSAIADFDGKAGGLLNQTVTFSSCTENQDDSLACFSNYGSVVDIAAPGVNILSTYKGGGTATMSGTSMASPHVAGAAALYKYANPGWTPSQVRSAILNNAFPQDSNCGYTDPSHGSTQPLLNLGGPCGGGGGGQNTPPTVNSTNPANNATGVAVGANITATFSEAMNGATINTSTFTVNGVTGAVSYSNNVATFNPNSDLAYSTSYTATITTGAQDSQGAGLAANYVWSFTTGAAPVNNPPQVSSTSPTNGATGVAVGANITATFNEDMTASTINTSTFTLSNGVTGTVTYNAGNRTATFDPSSNLANSTTYTATITTGVQDSTGLAMSSQYQWQFTTAGASTSCTAPVIASSSDTNTSGAGTVEFSWNAVPGASEYRIERSRLVWGFWTVWDLMTTTTSTSFSGTDGSNDPTWRVRVQSGSCTPVPGPWTTFDP